MQYIIFNSQQTVQTIVHVHIPTAH